MPDDKPHWGLPSAAAPQSPSENGNQDQEEFCRSTIDTHGEALKDSYLHHQSHPTSVDGSTVHFGPLRTPEVPGSRRFFFVPRISMKLPQFFHRPSSSSTQNLCIRQPRLHEETNFTPIEKSSEEIRSTHESSINTGKNFQRRFCSRG